MKYYVGIDLGTTNSAICTYDGKNTRIWKSPESNDITPSAIYVGKRGNRYYGAKAYQKASQDPRNAAILFKRFMGTNEVIHIDNTDEDLTPEECSSEIIKVLYGYLPEEIRNSDETATVITVPAAFNQMKKNATMQAAQKAGIQNVSIMQEPVAAIMSIMKNSNQEGTFLVYDLGGGTFDISIAENNRGKVNLLAHGGREMCGGRDIDRKLFNSIVLPWLNSHFSLPDNIQDNAKYKNLLHVAMYATEKAKIALSAANESTITIDDTDVSVTDEEQEDIYAQINLSRDELDEIMENLIDSTIDETRETLKKNGIDSSDIKTIVFVGGPTNYKPLRDKVCSALGIKPCIDVNPMTAVAEGASIFAESLNWDEDLHKKKSSIELLTSDDFDFKVQSRVNTDSARMQCITKKPCDGYTVEVVSKDTGWSSGRLPLTTNSVITLPIATSGRNTFAITIRDGYGKEIKLGNNTIEIMKTVATIGSIPASNSVGVEVLERIGGRVTLEFLVKEGDSLPASGEKTFKAGKILKGGSSDSLDFKLWEGEITDPVSDNRFVGFYKISGKDLDDGDVVVVGAEIVCKYEILDSGVINLKTSIPSIGASFGNKNFYTYSEGKVDLNDVDEISEEGNSLLKRIEQIQSVIPDSEALDYAYELALNASDMDTLDSVTPEEAQEACNNILEAKKILFKVRRENYAKIAKKEYDELYQSFFGKDGFICIANPDMTQEAKNLFARAKHFVDREDANFEDIKNQIEGLRFRILLQNDQFFISSYKALFRNMSLYSDTTKARALIVKCDTAIANGDMRTLRSTVPDLIDLFDDPAEANEMLKRTNILRS